MIISDDLKLGKHIAYISWIAGATASFLRQNHRNCPREFRRLAYITLVRSRLEYAETVWDQYYQQDIAKLEREQRQAARFITKDYRTREPGCVNRMLQDLNLPPTGRTSQTDTLRTYVQDNWRPHPRHNPPFKKQKTKTKTNKQKTEKNQAKQTNKTKKKNNPKTTTTTKQQQQQQQTKQTNYLTAVSASCRRIRPTKYEDFEATNIIERHEVRNTRGFQLPVHNTKQYQHSFFVQTVVDSNHLEENIIKAGSASASTSALSRSTPPAP